MRSVLVSLSCSQHEEHQTLTLQIQLCSVARAVGTKQWEQQVAAPWDDQSGSTVYQPQTCNLHNNHSANMRPILLCCSHFTQEHTVVRFIETTHKSAFLDWHSTKCYIHTSGVFPGWHLAYFSADSTKLSCSILWRNCNTGTKYLSKFCPICLA